MIKRNKMIQSTEAEATINVVTFEPRKSSQSN